MLNRFVNVEEVHMVPCGDGEMKRWRGRAQYYSWPCGPENVSVVNPKDGSMVRMMDF